MNQITLQNSRMGMQISSRCHANDWFKHFKPEQEREIKKIDIRESEASKQLKNAFTRKIMTEDPWNVSKLYKISQKAIENIDYASEDITLFSIALNEFQEAEYFAEKAGPFLSALINNCKEGKEKEYTIVTKHMLEKINDIGYGNTRHITIKGNAGDFLGRYMKNGKIVVHGDAGWNVGNCMSGGEIIVKGNTRNSAGSGMKNGSIIIEGNSDNQPGEHMKGGTIVVKGYAGWQIGWCMRGGTVMVEKGGIIDETQFRDSTGKIILPITYVDFLLMDKKSVTVRGYLIELGRHIQLEHLHGGDIYHKGKLIVKDGKRV